MANPRKYTDIKGKYTEIETTLSLDDYPKVEGYDFGSDKDVKGGKVSDFNKFLESYFSTGFQATHLSNAIGIVNMMRKEEATIYLSFTSNIISSGLRDIIRFLVKNKHVHVLCTTAGGIEEDVIKCFKPFVIGSFDAPGKYLFDRGINRTGNIFVPNDRYLYFEDFINKFFEYVYKKQKNEGIIYNSSELIKELGLFLDSDESYLTWAARNNIRVYCPAITDGSLGDLIYFAKKRYPDLKIDIVKDMEDIVDYTLQQKKTGVICLGGGVAKHFVLNANIFREGADFAVYVTTALEHDGSDSGGSAEEAVTWAKIKAHAPRVKVFCDATIAFPLIVAGSIANGSSDNDSKNDTNISKMKSGKGNKTKAKQL